MPRYFELIERHGNLKPLVDIKISAPYLVRTRLIYNQITHEKVVDVRQTVQQFKKYVHELYQIPLARVRIFHVDDVAFSMGIGGPEEMKYPQRFLHAYVTAQRLRQSRLDSELKATIRSFVALISNPLPIDGNLSL